MSTPPFWYSPSLLSRLLSPIGHLYYGIHKLRTWISRPHRFSKPVICVGNVTVGGVGKTPTIIALAKALRPTYPNLHIVSKGYGGTNKRPHRVAATDHPKWVGDEALLLARHAPTFVGKSRCATIAAAIDNGADLVLVDDGFQNPTFHKDFSLLLIEATHPVGNGTLFPAGPLREPLDAGMARADCILTIAPHSEATPSPALREKLEKAPCPVFHTHKALSHLPVSKALNAFTAIGNPEAFFTGLQQRGHHLLTAQSFRDHHFFTPAQQKALYQLIQATPEIPLVCTEKDAVKLQPPLKNMVTPIPLDVALPQGLLKVLHKKVTKA